LTDRIIGKSRGGNYDKAREQGSWLGAVLDSGDSDVESNASQAMFNSHRFLSLS
jgi:hypothetical protein